MSYVHRAAPAVWTALEIRDFAIWLRTVVSHRRRSRVVRALAVLFAASRASAQLVYEPFAYPPAAPLDAQVNPGNALPWSAMTDDPPGDDILLAGSNLSYTGLALSTGNSVTYAGAGKSERLGLGPVISTGSAYYSLVLQVNSLGAMTSTPVFVAGLSNRSGTSDLQPTTVGTRLYLRKSSETTFNLGVSKNSSTLANIAFGSTDYALGTPIFVVGEYAINGTTLGTDDISRLYINPTELGAASAPVVPSGGSAIVSAPAAGTDLFDAGAPSVAGFVLRQAVADVPGVQVDELRVDRTWAQVTPPVGVSWSVDDNGSWSENPKWSTAVSPNNADVFVNFPAITSTPRTVTVDAPVALRTINFTSAIGYQIAGSSALNFSTAAAVNVRAGSHEISAPLTLAGDFLVGVDSGRSLMISTGLSSPSSILTKAGAGTLEVKHARVGALSVAGGTMRVLADGSSAGTSRVGSIEVVPGAKLDLRNNDLIVTNVSAGTWNGSAYTGVTALLASGFANGAWTGSGLVTSQTDATTGDLTTLAVASASDALGIAPSATAMWSGQTVTGTDALVMYTYGGDANLSGNVDVDDYGQIDFSTSTGGALKGYFNGDFNYDGVIDVDDYGIIDFTVNIQGPPLSNSMAVTQRVTGVPEPALLAPIAVAGVLLRMLHRDRKEKGA